jgi:hypothetical protein
MPAALSRKKNITEMSRELIFSIPL